MLGLSEGLQVARSWPPTSLFVGAARRLPANSVPLTSGWFEKGRPSGLESHPPNIRKFQTIHIGESVMRRALVITAIISCACSITPSADAQTPCQPNAAGTACQVTQ